MTEYMDISTRRLKRRYLGTIRRVWRLEVAESKSLYPREAARDTANARKLRDGIKEELAHRGWTV